MKKMAIIVVAILVQACAFTDAKLDVQSTSDANFIGPIGELSALSFSAPEFEDVREDKERIGYKKNGFGANTADIMTKTPVEEIISNGISNGLSQNGHSVIDDGSIRIQGAVKHFWFETDVNFWDVEFIGEVQCKVEFIDQATKELIYAAEYSGTHSEKKAAGLNKTWQTVMSRAVDKLVEDIVFDEDLSEALELRRAEQQVAR